MISNTIKTPNDHQSTLSVYPDRGTTSEAKYSTVPQKL
jgi:hypothetical protein